MGGPGSLAPRCEAVEPALRSCLLTVAVARSSGGDQALALPSSSSGGGLPAPRHERGDATRGAPNAASGRATAPRGGATARAFARQS